MGDEGSFFAGTTPILKLRYNEYEHEYPLFTYN